jgi:hypothetical protein
LLVSATENAPLAKRGNDHSLPKVVHGDRPAKKQVKLALRVRAAALQDRFRPALSHNAPRRYGVWRFSYIEYFHEQPSYSPAGQGLSATFLSLGASSSDGIRRAGALPKEVLWFSRCDQLPWFSVGPNASAAGM